MKEKGLWRFLLGLKVPYSHRTVQGAGGHKGFTDTDGQASDGLGVEGVGQELKMCLLPLVDNVHRCKSGQKKTLNLQNLG